MPSDFAIIYTLERVDSPEIYERFMRLQHVLEYIPNRTRGLDWYAVRDEVVGTPKGLRA